MALMLATATLALGGAKAVLNRNASRAESDEYRRAGQQALLTEYFNSTQRTKEGQLAQMGALEQGGQLIDKIRKETVSAGGEAEAKFGSSGAVVGAGSSRQVLTQIAIDGMKAQGKVVKETRQLTKAIGRETQNANVSGWRNAKNYASQLNRQADNKDSAADKQFLIDLVETGISAYTAGASVGGADMTKWKWGLEGAKTVKDVSTISSTTSQRTKRTKGGGVNTRVGFATTKADIRPKGKYGDRVALRTGGKHLPPPLPGRNRTYLRGTWRHGIGRNYKNSWKPITARKNQSIPAGFTGRTLQRY